MNSHIHFSGKFFDYSIVTNKLLNDSITWKNSLEYIHIENLFTPFFNELDSSVDLAFENNLQNIIILYPHSYYYLYNDFQQLNHQNRNAMMNKNNLYIKDTNNIWDKFNVDIIDEKTGNINDKLVPFSRKINRNNQQMNMLSIYYKDWYYLIDSSDISDKNSNENFYKIISEYIPINFIEYLFTINGFNFREIVLNKFIGIKEIHFEKYHLEVIFF
jgi:hypothetical protein